MQGSSRFPPYPGMFKTCLNHFFALLTFGGKYSQGLSKIPTALKIRIKNNMALRRCPDRVLAGLTYPLNDLQLHTCSLQKAWIKPKPNQQICEKMPLSSNTDGIQTKRLFSHITLAKLLSLIISIIAMMRGDRCFLLMNVWIRKAVLEVLKIYTTCELAILFFWYLPSRDIYTYS